MPSRFDYALLLMLAGGLLIVGPILHGPVTPPAYEYRVEETTVEDRLTDVATDAPTVDVCIGAESRECALERSIAAAGGLTVETERHEDRNGTVPDSGYVYLPDEGFLDRVATYHGNGSLTYGHESVDDDEILEAVVVSEERVRLSDAAVESIEEGRVRTDEPIDLWEDDRVAAYEGSYYEATYRAYRTPTEPWYWTAARALLVSIGFVLLLYGRKVEVLDAIEGRE